MSAAPMIYEWSGEGMVPVGPRFKKEADASFVIGQRYRLTDIEDRSDASHKHEFAWLREAWHQLPEDLAAEYPTPEHLRKRALIEAKYYNETIVDAGSNAAAIRVASAFRAREQFAVVIVRGPLVAIREAMSQSRRAMDGKTFQESKQKVLEIVADMIGVGVDELNRNAARAA